MFSRRFCCRSTVRIGRVGITHGDKKYTTDRKRNVMAKDTCGHGPRTCSCRYNTVMSTMQLKYIVLFNVCKKSSVSSPTSSMFFDLQYVSVFFYFYTSRPPVPYRSSYNCSRIYQHRTNLSRSGRQKTFTKHAETPPAARTRYGPVVACQRDRATVQERRSECDRPDRVYYVSNAISTLSSLFLFVRALDTL